MMETARRLHGAPVAFRYRGLHPLFPEDAPQVAVWPASGTAHPVAVVARGGHMTMRGEVAFA